MPAAHTDGDSAVFFRRSDVISAGDVFVTTSYPVIDLANGGSYVGIVNALDRLVDIIIPVYGQDGGTLVIPGHGRLPRNDRQGHDARAGKGRQGDVGLRPRVWVDDGILDDGSFHRGCL